MVSSIANQILQAGIDDWVPFIAIEGFARAGGARSDEEAADRALDALQELIDAHLVEIGEVSDGGFFEWDTTPKEAITRVRNAIRTLAPDDLAFFCWASNTPRGDELARLATASGSPVRYRCPVCGYPNLFDQPRSETTGGGSYEICPSCGFEFGVSDDDEHHTYEEWRRAWISDGMPWRSMRPVPDGWDPVEQLEVLDGE